MCVYVWYLFDKASCRLEQLRYLSLCQRHGETAELSMLKLITVCSETAELPMLKLATVSS